MELYTYVFGQQGQRIFLDAPTLGEAKQQYVELYGPLPKDIPIGRVRGDNEVVDMLKKRFTNGGKPIG